MKQIIALSIVTGVCVGCAGVAQDARQRLQPVVREAIAEKSAWNDLEFQTWEDLKKLADLYACNLSKGSIDRNATDEQRAEIEAVKCPE